MSASDPCRVVVHAEGASVDLALPATLPVAVLIPSIVDILGGAVPAATRYQLARPGASPLPNSTTLAQNGIGDGAVLILSRDAPEPALLRRDDEVEAVSAAIGTSNQSRWATRAAAALAAICLTAAGALALACNAFSAAPHADAIAAVAAAAAVTALISAGFAYRVHGDPVAGLTLGGIATTFAAVAGLLAVPGVPGAPNVLLAAMAAAVTAVLSIRVSQCGVAALTAIACCAVITAGAALASVLTGAAPHVVGSLTALACLGLIEAAPRLSIRMAGLAPRLDLDNEEAPHTEAQMTAKALRADSWLTSLRAGFATAAAIGATAAALAAHRAIALAAVTGGLLLLHARMDQRRALIFAATGIGTLTTTFAIAAHSAPRHGPSIAALTATAAAVAMYLGFVAPVISLSPVTRRGVEALGCVALTAVVPLACWTCGAFGAVRGLNLLRT